MARYVGLPLAISLIATIALAYPLGLLFTIRTANLVASLLVATAMICAFVLQRNRIGPNRSLLKLQYFLYAALWGPVLIWLLMLREFLDVWLGVTPGRQSLIGLVLLLAFWWSLMFLLPRVFFSATERAELKAKGKALRVVEKFWASSTPVSAVPGASKLRARSGGRL